ncbi:MAG: phage head closure protein [Leptolyngbyaceae bacterium]|nr:phage head closure protein [Leptolyngbyaceae bacterium]
MLQTRIRRGELDKQVTFLKKIVGSNDTNEDETDGWEEIDDNPTVWAKILQKEGGEQVVADQIISTVRTSIWIDWRGDIKPEYRIVYNTKVYNIISIIENQGERRGFLMISADLIPNQLWT